MPKTLNNKVWVIGLLLIVPTMLLAACGGGSFSEDLEVLVQFDLAIENGAINIDPPVMKVRQRYNVTFNIASDKMGSFHLHGYDIETDVGPSRTVTMSFTADATGSFPITFHGATHTGSHESEGDSHSDSIEGEHEGEHDGGEREEGDHEGDHDGGEGEEGEHDGEEVTLGSLEVHPR